eukprot:GFUD01008776.1.p1 GENE.GFUD01008776.1~~GFUD01008776.1.p1  ORF type:complete len:849 (-),score=226.54 GFUD01008776.1:157-2703(-)
MEDLLDTKSEMKTRLGQWLTDLVSRAETGIPVTKVFRLYQEDFGEHFPMRQLGCFNAVKALESLSEFVSIECQPETGEKLIFPPIHGEVSTRNSSANTLDNTEKDSTNDNNLVCQKKTILKPHRGTFQLTFINHFQLEKCVLMDYFQYEQGFIGANILSGLKRRCFVSYKNEQDALTALENLKGNETLVELDVADDCKMDNYDDQVQQNQEEEVPEIYECRGSFQLSFTTTRFINIGDLTSMFSTYGQVSEVCSNFRKIKGRARVFVKYPDKIQALSALRQLRHQFDDLGVAKCCLKEAVIEIVIPQGKDGTFSLRFKNIGPEGEIFRRQEIYQMFGQFGEVSGVTTDAKFWTYIRFSSCEDAMAAYQEFSIAQNLPNFGIAEHKDDPNNTAFVKKTKFEVEENDMEIFIANFPAKIGVNKLRKIFTNFQDITFREFKVNKTKAFCFAQLPDYDEMKRAVMELHGSIHYNRNLIVRAKIQEVQERIEAELLEEMATDRDIMINTGEDWEGEASEENVFYDENIRTLQKASNHLPDIQSSSEGPHSQPIPTITGNRPTHQIADSPAQTFQFPPPLTLPSPLTRPPSTQPPSPTQLSPQPPLTQPPPLIQPPSVASFSQPPPPISQPPPLIQPPSVASFSQPPPPIHNPRVRQAKQSLPRTFMNKRPGQQQGLSRQSPYSTPPPQRQSFLCNNPSLRVAGITPLSQPITTPPKVSVTQDSGYISNSANTSMMSGLGDIKVSVDNNLFAPEKISRKRKSELDLNTTNPLKDEGVELVLANFAEGTSGADIFKLLDPFNVAAVNMAVNKLSPGDDFTYSFVRFSSREEAEKAIQQLDGKPLLNSNQIVLEFA